ncbi:MAG: hypothetical protein ABW185_01750 [Sedimenticola sp.]
MASNSEIPIQAPSGDGLSADDQLTAFKITDYYHPLSPVNECDETAVKYVCTDETAQNCYDNDNFYQDRNESQTPIYLDMDNQSQERYEIQSQPIPNQQIFTSIDQRLQHLPKDIYIEKLRLECKDCEDTISMYRSILAKRARSKDNCPPGCLITRKTTKSASSSSRYATDCYNIQKFIDNGDPKDVVDIFTKKRTVIKTEEKEPECVGFETICIDVSELRGQLNIAKQEISVLKAQRENDARDIKRLEKAINDMKSAISKPQPPPDVMHPANQGPTVQRPVNAANNNSDQPPPTTIHHSEQQPIAKRTCMDVTTNVNVGKTPNRTNNTLHVEDNTIAHSDGTILIQSDDIKSNTPYLDAVKQNNSKYADIEHTQKKHTPKHNENTPITITDKQQHKQPNNQHANNNEDAQLTTSNASAQQKTLFYTDPQTKKRYRTQNNIPVIVSSRQNNDSQKDLKHVSAADTNNDNAQAQASDEDPVFECVSAKRTRRYYVGGIARTSNRAGFLTFLKQKNINPAGLRLIETNRGSLAAKLTVNLSDGYRLEDKSFWPGKFYCRRWYGNNTWNSKFTNNDTEESKNYYDYDQYSSNNVD